MQVQTLKVYFGWRHTDTRSYQTVPDRHLRWKALKLDVYIIGLRNREHLKAADEQEIESRCHVDRRDVAAARGNQPGPVRQVDVGKTRTRKAIGAASPREGNASIGTRRQAGERSASGTAQISEGVSKIPEPERTIRNLVGAWETAALADGRSQDRSHDR